MEAKIIKTDGSEITVTPKNGKTFELTEMQESVDGYIEFLYLDKDSIMVVNEEGRLNGLGFNLSATNLVRERLKANHIIVGNVMVVPRSMVN